MFNLASYARHYFGAILLSALLLTLGGIYSATRMPSAVYPEVTFPRISVIARKPGLDVPNMQVKVTVPLEEAVATVIGIAQVRSKTIRGASELSLEFQSRRQHAASGAVHLEPPRHRALETAARRGVGRRTHDAVGLSPFCRWC